MRVPKNPICTHSNDIINLLDIQEAYHICCMCYCCSVVNNNNSLMVYGIYSQIGRRRLVTFIYIRRMTKLIKVVISEIRDNI